MSATEPTNEKVDKANASDDDDADIDQLVEELQSHKGLGDDEEEEEEDDGASFKAVPEELLQTDQEPV